MGTPTIIFMGVRRVPLEVNAALLAAYRAGYKVALLSPSAPRLGGDVLADVETVDIFDRPAALNAALNLAKRTNACGVVSWTDIGVELAAALADRCGWPGVPVEAARKARNKHSMRAAMAGHPELIPRFRGVRSLDDLVAAHGEIGAPAVLKPAAAAAAARSSRSGRTPTWRPCSPRPCGSPAPPSRRCSPTTRASSSTRSGWAARSTASRASCTTARCTSPASPTSG